MRWIIANRQLDQRGGETPLGELHRPAGLIDARATSAGSDATAADTKLGVALARYSGADAARYMRQIGDAEFASAVATEPTLMRRRSRRTAARDRNARSRRPGACRRRAACRRVDDRSDGTPRPCATIWPAHALCLDHRAGRAIPNCSQVRPRRSERARRCITTGSCTKVPRLCSARPCPVLQAADGAADGVTMRAKRMRARPAGSLAPAAARD